MKILAISGSLREKSFNTSILKTIQLLNSDVEICTSIGKLPFFNPDLDDESLEDNSAPLLVQEFRKKITLSDVIIFSTPEYAFEISGVLKNALEWLVSSGVMDAKKVIVISASTSGMGGDKANEVLCNLLKVLIGKEVSLRLTVDRVNKKIDDKGQIHDPVLLTDLNRMLSYI